MLTVLKAASLAAVVSIGLVFGQAQAATVSTTSSATFEFDLSGWAGPTDINFGQFGNDTPGLICPNTPDPCLAGGATVQWDFGTTFGGNELGTRYFTSFTPTAQSGFNGSIFNGTPVLPPPATDVADPLAVPVSPSTIYITAVYFDDEFDITFLNIRGNLSSPALPNIQPIVSGTLVEVAPVPLPAAAWFLLSALGGLGLAGWRRRKVAA